MLAIVLLVAAAHGVGALAAVGLRGTTARLLAAAGALVGSLGAGGLGVVGLLGPPGAR